jgi:hypothetical protein
VFTIAIVMGLVRLSQVGDTDTGQSPTMNNERRHETRIAGDEFIFLLGWHVICKQTSATT